jgi:hypothetical protein
MNEIYSFNVFNPDEGYHAFDAADDLRDINRTLMSATDGQKTVGQGVSDYFLGTRGGAGLLTNPQLGTWGGTTADVATTLAGFGPIYGATFGRGGLKVPSRASLAGGGLLQESTKDSSKIMALGHKAASTVEAYIRIAPFIALRRQGLSAAEAAKKVFKAQVDYRNLTRFEREFMRSVIPFYSFTKGMLPFVVEDILMRPGGRQAHLIKGLARITRDDEKAALAPGWMRRGAAIPIGAAGGGGLFSPADPSRQRYIRKIGAPFEDVLSLLSLTSDRPVKRSLTGVLSRFNPIAKSLYEQSSGKSLFFDRDLRDLESKYFRDGAGSWSLGPGAEALIDIIPGASRGASFMKKIWDPKKYGPETGTILNELMPWDYFDVNLEEQRNRSIQQMLDPMLHGQYGVRQLPKRLYLSRPQLEQLRGTDPEGYRKYVLYSTSVNRMIQAAREKRLREQSATGSY